MISRSKIPKPKTVEEHKNHATITIDNWEERTGEKLICKII
jgi:hypothetical protein